MLSEDKYFQTLTEDELWQRYCGFLDLSIEEFMEIQKELLMDEIDRIADSTLGKKIMGNRKPRSVEEFRQMVPLTTYDDYEPYLSERREDVLGAKPCSWIHSSGKGGYFKWIPQSFEIVEKGVRGYLASFILASANRRNKVNIAPGFHLLAPLPPPPYTSGFATLAIAQRMSLQAMPPLEEAGTTGFQERMQKGFQMALKEGVDIMGSIASILVKMGEQFSEQTRRTKFSVSMLHPKVIVRLLRAWLRSKREGRAILPKDLWSPKGIVASGVDTSIYKDDIAYYWGRIPYEIYAGTEAFVYALQGWNKKGLTFLPDMVFLEFIPHEDQPKSPDGKDSQPSTVLLGELEKGKSYEVVITQFHGMPLLRYRMNDLVKVIAMKDEEAGTNLPQIIFQRRVGEVIDLAGLAQLDEKTIWQAIANTGIKYADWSACKEYDQKQTFLRIYLELKEGKEVSELERMIDEQLKIVDTDYRDIDAYLKLQPVKVTLLSRGTFQRYMEDKMKEGADLAHMKPNHINAPELVIKRLLQLSEASSKQ